MGKLTWKQYLSCVGHRVMKFVKKRRTVGWLLALVVWLAVIERGMNTAELGTRKDCHGILQVDSSVKPQYLMTRLPLAGAGIGEQTPAINPGYTKYSYVHQRQSNKKYQGSPPPLWLQKLLYRTLLTVLYIKRTFTHIFQSTRVLLQFTVSYVRALPALLRARMLVSITVLSVKTLFSALCRRHIRKAIGCVAVVQQRMYCGAHTARYRIRQVMETRPLPFVTSQVILNVCVVYADQPHCTPGHGMTKGRFRDFTKVREGVTGISTRPRQWLCTKTKLVLFLLLCLVLWRCGLVCHLTGYDVGVIEMLLMMSGDVEPNPGPVLRPSDLLTVLTELREVNAEWYILGLALNFAPGILDAMKAPHKENKHCMLDMVKEWLTTSSNPSWERLIAALRHPLVDNEALARELEAKHCSQASPQASAEVVPDIPVPDHPSTRREPLGTLHAQGHTGNEIRMLKAEFTSLVESAHDAVMKLTGKQKIYPSDFRQRLSQPEYGDFINKDYLGDLQRHDTLRGVRPQSPTVEEMWDKLSRYWNYFNYGLLEHVISQFGDGDLKQKMKNYVTELDKFKQRTRLSEYVKYPPSSSHALTELEVQIKHPDCKLEQVELVIRKLASELIIPKEFMVIFKVKAEDCICISWLIPPSLESTLEKSLLKVSSAFLKGESVLAITLGEYKYYSFELEKFAGYLRKTYDSQTPKFVANQWPPPPTETVFKLAMIHSKETEVRNPFDHELIKQTVQGKVDDIMKKKTSIQLENLFKHCHDATNRKVVLVEGAPGAGKSTLAWHVVKKWKAQDLFREFTIVIYAQLRDPEVQSATSIAELLPTHPKLNREDVAADMVVCLGSKVLFVLDGWDEYEPGFQQDSLISELIRNPANLHLHHRTLLVTSRPIASHKLQQYASSRVEIVGFTPEELHWYFKDAVKDPEAVKNLREQLQKRPVVEASCYLPLNAAIVAHLFLEGKYDALPTTLHELFSAVICGCIRRFLKKHMQREEEIPSLDELPPDLEKEFNDICTLAHVGTMKNKVSFTTENLRSYQLSIERNALDLMQVVHTFASRKSTLYHFLHLSVQELLTARQISLLPLPEQMEVFNTMFNNPRFAAVFRFYASFTKLQAKGIRDIVTRIAQSGEKQSLLNLMHCLYEAQDVSLCRFVAYQLSSFNHELQSPLEFLSVGFFLSCLNENADREFTVDLTRSSHSGHTTRFLADGLSQSLSVDDSRVLHPSVALKLDGSKIQDKEDGLNHMLQALTTNTSIVRLWFKGCGLQITKQSGLQLRLAEMLTRNRTLQELDLSGNLIDGSGLGYIAAGLKHNTGLQKLSLQSCGLEATEDNSQLEKMLRENNTLRELNLAENPKLATLKGNLKGTRATSTLSYIARGLAENTTLQRLSLQDCRLQLTEDNVSLILSSSLQELDLSGNAIGPGALGYVAKHLTHNTRLLRLLISRCFRGETSKSDCELLEKVLRTNSTLEELDISQSYAIGNDTLLALGRGLSSNRSLKTLNAHLLLAVTLDGWGKFITCLQENHHLTTLVIGPGGIHPIQEAAKSINTARRKKHLPRLTVEVLHYSH